MHWSRSKEHLLQQHAPESFCTLPISTMTCHHPQRPRTGISLPRPPPIPLLPAAAAASSTAHTRQQQRTMVHLDSSSQLTRRPIMQLPAGPRLWKRTGDTAAWRVARLTRSLTVRLQRRLPWVARRKCGTICLALRSAADSSSGGAAATPTSPEGHSLHLPPTLGVASY